MMPLHFIARSLRPKARRVPRSNWSGSSDAATSRPGQWPSCQPAPRDIPHFSRKVLASMLTIGPTRYSSAVRSPVVMITSACMLGWLWFAFLGGCVVLSLLLCVLLLLFLVL